MSSNDSVDLENYFFQLYIYFSINTPSLADISAISISYKL